MKLKVVVGLLVVLILAFTVFGEDGLIKLVRADHQKQALVRESQKLREENARLRREIELLAGNDVYLDRIAREELGMVGKDELVLQFVKPEARP